MKERAPRTIDLYFDKDVQPAIFNEITGIKDLIVKGDRASCTVIGSEAQLLTISLANGLQSVRTHEPTLDEIFLSLVSAGKPQ